MKTERVVLRSIFNGCVQLIVIISEPEIFSEIILPDFYFYISKVCFVIISEMSDLKVMLKIALNGITCVRKSLAIQGP